MKTAFTLRYQDIMVGTGTEAEPGQVYKVHYTGWLAADGRNANELTGQALTDMGQAPTFYDCLVEIEVDATASSAQA